MESELALLQQKMASLEQKLTQGWSSTVASGFMHKLDEISGCRLIKKENSRLSINLDKFEQQNEGILNPRNKTLSETQKELTTNQHENINQSLDSDICKSNAKSKAGRRAESANIRSSRTHLTKIDGNTSTFNKYMNSGSK